MDARRDLGTLIRRAREAKGYSQLYLATAMGYAGADFISKIELGMVALPVKHIPKISEHLGLKADDLIKAKLKVAEQDMKYRMQSASHA